MEILYIVTAVLFLALPEASAQSARLACTALKNVVIRSLFPMTVLSRLISRSRALARLTKALSRSRLWKRLSLSDALLPSVLTGAVSGLPVSARDIEELLKKGEVTPREAAKAVALSSLPSPAFVILVASSSFSEGICRYTLLLASAYLTVSAFRSEKSKGRREAVPISFYQALSSSVSSALSVSASIVFFSAMSSLAAAVLPALKGVIAVFFEMGSGIVTAEGNGILTALALGWCGLSALSQLRSEAPSVNFRPYLTARAVSVAALLTLEIINLKLIQ